MMAALVAIALGSVIEVTAIDAATKKPAAGVVVEVTHVMSCFKHETRDGEPQCKPTDPHPEALLRLRGTTGKDRRFTARVPDLNYEVNVSVQGTDASLKPWELKRSLRDLPELRRIRPAGKG